jgi:hypothetical protein
MWASLISACRPRLGTGKFCVQSLALLGERFTGLFEQARAHECHGEVLERAEARRFHPVHAQFLIEESETLSRRVSFHGTHRKQHARPLQVLFQLF